jgi:two-component system phosphate regulon response regulator PhoB
MPVASDSEPFMTQSRILIIEDERALVEPLVYSLKREGYDVMAAYDGLDGLRQAQLQLPDLIVLDLMLPLKPGLEVCRELKSASYTSHIPIIMLTARSEESDQLMGFAVGADDYVTKPYSVKVLVERIKKELRKQQSQAESGSKASQMSSQGITLDKVRHQVTFQGEVVPLTPTEFRLLEGMMRQPGRAFTRHDLMDSAIGEDAVVLERTIDVHIKSLRRKLGDGNQLIETVRGVGYRFREPR